MKKLLSLILSLIILASGILPVSFSACAADSSVNEDCIKILLIGNSYIYYNNCSLLLCNMANAAGKDCLVVGAYKSGEDAFGLLNDKVYYNAWYQGELVQTGKGYLDGIAKIDFGSIGREGEWDYVVLQNNSSAQTTGMGDIYMIGLFSPMLESNKNFIINSNYWIYSLEKDRHSEHLAVCKATGCSIIDTRGLYSQYHNVFNNQVWFKDLTTRDSRNHPSVLGTYIFALSIYAKIFGTEELSSGIDDETMLPFYNSDGGTVDEIVDTSKFVNNYTLNESIDREKAALLQSLVKKYAPFYIGPSIISGDKTLPSGEVDEDIRYYNENGEYCDGWIQLSNYTYYLDKGYIVTDCFKNIGDELYYFTKSGERYSGWKTIGSKTYFFYYDGSVAKGFVEIPNDKGEAKTFYFNSNGEMLTGKQVIDGKTYLFSNSNDSMQMGEMFCNAWKTVVNSKGVEVKYYYDSNGVMATGIKNIKGKTYAFSPNGKLLKSTLVTVNNKTYYANKNGVVKKNKFVSVNGARYYFNKNGVMQKKRFITSGNNKYYADKTGKIRKGWITIKNKTYYFSKTKTKKFPKYAMVTGKVKIDGKNYKFTKAGVCKNK